MGSTPPAFCAAIASSIAAEMFLAEVGLSLANAATIDSVAFMSSSASLPHSGSEAKVGLSAPTLPDAKSLKKPAPRTAPAASFCFHAWSAVSFSKSAILPVALR